MIWAVATPWYCAQVSVAWCCRFLRGLETFVASVVDTLKRMGCLRYCQRQCAAPLAPSKTSSQLQTDLDRRSCDRWMTPAVISTTHNAESPARDCHTCRVERPFALSINRDLRNDRERKRRCVGAASRNEGCGDFLVLLLLHLADLPSSTFVLVVYLSRKNHGSIISLAERVGGVGVLPRPHTAAQPRGRKRRQESTARRQRRAWPASSH